MEPYLDVTHVAIRVPSDLRSAEAYYCSLFDLEVSWREPVPDGAPFDLGWDELDRTGVQPVIVMLHSGALRISVAIDQAADRRTGVIEHVGVQVSAEQMQRVRFRALAAGHSVVAERSNELFDFVDAYGVEWELDTRSFADPLAIVTAKRERAGIE